MSAVGWGKLILLGEHAVVYGYPALAAALDRGVTIDAVPTTKGGLRLVIPEWNVSVKADDDSSVARCLSAVADALFSGRHSSAIPGGRPQLSLVGDAQIPHGAGLGSSAALAVAIARALLQAANQPADVATLAHAASASETIIHGKPSGVDVALAITGGLGVFRRSTGLIPLKRADGSVPSLRVLVGPSGQPRSTGTMVQKVAEATGERPADKRLSELGGLCDTGTVALLANDLPALGATMNRAHAVLSDLGVSTPVLDGLCAKAIELGAHGAKLTGAGGGGAVIAIAPRDKEQAILAAWKTLAVTGFVAVVGAR
ncbi:MAG: mevalonate kinase [Deltaproteobacteria bacterium]|nr:mevalonate kinase [Deltaproteobacteria bacterium]